jgi:hypothetical protein
MANSSDREQLKLPLDTLPATLHPVENLHPGPIQHETLNAVQISRIRLIRACLLEVHPKTMAAWVDGFRRDQDPDYEIAWWEHLAACYLEFIALIDASAQQRQEAFSLLSGLMLSPRPEQVRSKIVSLSDADINTAEKLVRSSVPISETEEPSSK